MSYINEMVQISIGGSYSIPLLEESELYILELAKQFNVTTNTIRNIANKRYWKHI